MEAAFALLIFVHSKEKKLELTFSNFLTIKKLEQISQIFLTMAKTINTESIIEAWEGERYLWDVNSVIYKNRYEKAKSRKKLAEQFSVTGTVKGTLMQI